jgi:DNA invertase Pin-like site-specific DNA recombinase
MNDQRSVPLTAEKIAPHHCEQRAYVYVRQSSPQQVRHHQESQRNQYALVERAVALGWPPEHVHIIDADLGQSGQDGQRPGFRELVAEVSLGRVGLILAYEASRLARNNADWYALLDLAALRGTLLADTEGIYDPRNHNDRLLLGLRGMLSEAELHLLQLRMAAGRQRQIERGEYRQHLPTGLVRLEDGRVVKDPDLQVQRTLALVFARFAALGSCQKVLRRFRDEGLRLPRRQTSGPEVGVLLWKPPSEHVIYEILHNPAYAGAFVYGRHRRHPDSRPGQHSPRINCSLEEWAVIRRDAYPAYLSWEEFVANQARLHDNGNRYRERMRGAARNGSALLAGLVVCGQCGRQMQLEYKAHHRYVCTAQGKERGAGLCLHLDGPSIDAVVVAAFFEALQPAELDLLDAVLAAQEADRARLAQQYTDQVARAEYEARLAQRQYLAADPDNRLVAGELERRWELALRALAEAHEAAERFATAPTVPILDATMRTQLRDLGQYLPALWASGQLTPAHKKELLRSLIRRIVLTKPRPDTVVATVIWVSGAMTPLTAHPPLNRTANLGEYNRLVARLGTLCAAGYQDGAIARQLTAEGFRSAHHDHVPTTLVTRLRRQHGFPSLTTQFRHHARIDGQWTVWGLARALHVDRDWLYARIKDGTLPATRHPVIGHYLIPDDPAVLAQLKALLPVGRQM